MILNVLSVLIILAASSMLPQSTSPQSSSSQYQSALILEVKEHHDQARKADDTDAAKSYDVALRVKDTEHVVLITPRPGQAGFQYSAGRDILVLVESNTITFNDILGRPVTAPIISQRKVAAKNKRY